MTIGTKIHTFLFGKKIGQDQFGNCYYVEKKSRAIGRTKRWVIYRGEAEASKVPADWHGWLHYTTDIIPAASGLPTRKFWSKPHQQNLTGTNDAYLPAGHTLSSGQRPTATGDYQAWKP